MTVLNQWVSLSFCLVNHMDYAFVIQAELILGVLAYEWSHWNKLHKKKKMKPLSCFYFSFGQSLISLNDSILKATLKAIQKLSQASKLLSNILQWNSIFSQWLVSPIHCHFYLHECWMEYQRIQLLRALRLFSASESLINSCGWSTAQNMPT